MKTYEVSRENLKLIHQIACDRLKHIILNMAARFQMFEYTMRLTEDDVKKIFDAAANDDQLTVLRSVFPDFKEKGDWRNWTTLEDVCRVTNVNINELDIPKGNDNHIKRFRGIVLFDICQLICKAFREGVELDYSNKNQEKHYLWGPKTASGWSLAVVGSRLVGARLSVDSREKAEHIWKYFSKYFIDFWEGK